MRPIPQRSVAEKSDIAIANEKARELFAEAGYDAARPLRIKLTIDVGDIHEKVSLTVSSMCRDVLGIEVELEKKVAIDEQECLIATVPRRPQMSAFNSLSGRRIAQPAD